ncbi:hypothetical protein EYF80_060986 [Liparis tanakae]|uniref:Uncharacterized protein n=1 Tax=Liparis tanakae TaxID=230148 RepID=A0A4Z2EJ23_9TELE|nr:hypothetical protein EYF80_060986 [Liparis tanakae]
MARKIRAEERRTRAATGRATLRAGGGGGGGTRGGGVWLVRPLRGKKARLKDDTDVGLRPNPAICRGETGQFTASHDENAAGD